MDVNELRLKLEKYQQQHLLRFWDQLSEKEQEALSQEIQHLNLEDVMNCFSTAVSSLGNDKQLLDHVEPIPTESIESESSSDPEDIKRYRDLGLLEIAEGRTAVLLMAGGQGTRLGVSYPKGVYDVGLPSHSSLFKLQALRIRKLQQLAKERFGKYGEIQWYIMTSDSTDEYTMTYFKKNDYFGLRKENIRTFRQSMFPCFTFDGKIVLDAKGRICQAPDGNGGLYNALKKEGILDDMKIRGIRSVHTFSVDNILVKVADPIFVGYCLSRSADCGAKVVEKRSPTEAVGVICKVDGRYRVVEYSEMKKETMELRRTDGKLIFDAGNICNHYFTVDFLNMIANKYEKQLDLHVAKKKIPVVNEFGIQIVPLDVNGIKIEKFVFDTFKFAEKFVAWQVDRKSEFSPLKNSNKVGIDCPTTAKNDVLALHKQWLLNAGALSVKNDVEISPLLSYTGENLVEIAKGQIFEGPIVLENV